MSGSAPKLCLIVAVAENGVIGDGGKMPWHIPAELKYFKQRTLGKPVIMGRKTFQSIGKPLPGRVNIVISRVTNFEVDGVWVARSLPEAMVLASGSARRSGEVEVMVIGGGEIYAQALPLAQRVYLTRIGASPDGDAVFPALDPALWRLVEEVPISPAEQGRPSAVGLVYDRIA